MSESRQSAGRVPPHSLDAEKSVLGAMLLSPKAAALVMQTLNADDFYLAAHGRIYDAMASLSAESQAADLVTVVNRLEQMGALDAVGGYAYLADLSDFVPTTANTELYAKIVKSNATLRRLIDVCGSISQECFDANKDAQTIIDQAQKAIYEVTQVQTDNEFVDIKTGLNKVAERMEERQNDPQSCTGLKTGFPDIDRRILGLNPGKLILIAARPAMGKTVLASNIAINAAAYNPQCKGVAIFSMEMDYEEIYERVLSSKSGMRLRKIQTGDLTDNEWTAISDDMDKLAGLPVYVSDIAGRTDQQIMASCRSLQMEKGLSLVVIDYLQLISAAKKTNSLREEVTEISRNMKMMAMELKVPVILLSQLSRACEQRQNKRPVLSDLRESGSIEQDADVVMFIYREDYYNQEKARHNPSILTNEAEILTRKVRNGATGMDVLTWNGDTVRFMDVDKMHEAPDAPMPWTN